MNNKELILKRLLEDKHITIEEMFILNEKENNTVVIKDLFNTTPIPLPWLTPNPFWYNTVTCNTNLLNNTLPSDYKMD